jgi:hypothetical protein
VDDAKLRVQKERCKIGDWPFHLCLHDYWRSIVGRILYLHLYALSTVKKMFKGKLCLAPTYWFSLAFSLHMIIVSVCFTMYSCFCWYKSCDCCLDRIWWAIICPAIERWWVFSCNLFGFSGCLIAMHFFPNDSEYQLSSLGKMRHVNLPGASTVGVRLRFGHRWGPQTVLTCRQMLVLSRYTISFPNSEVSWSRRQPVSHAWIRHPFVDHALKASDQPRKLVFSLQTALYNTSLHFSPIFPWLIHNFPQKPTLFLVCIQLEELCIV